LSFQLSGIFHLIIRTLPSEWLRIRWKRRRQHIETDGVILNKAVPKFSLLGAFRAI